jgi:hypothetical protein
MPEAKSRSLIVILLVGIFLLALYYSDVLFMPKLLIFILILGTAAVFNKLDDLVRNWFVFLAFVYLTDSLRGLIYYVVCKLSLPVRVLYVLRGEQAIYGPTIPSVAFQRAVLTPGAASGEFTGLQKFLTFIHGSHFVVFLLIGLVLWLRRSRFFRAYKASFYALFSMGLLGYLLVPTAPPWMASELFGLVPKLLHFNVAFYNAAAPDLTTGFNTNPIAAMPSLHAAFPALCSLILWRLGRWKSLPFHLYTLLVFFMIIATGDHYTLDIAAGVLLAVVAYIVAFRRIGPPAPADDHAAETGRRTRALVVGSVLFALGIGVGMFTRNGFRKTPEAFYYGAGPRFADIFAREAEFGDNYGAQYYFGNHHLIRGDAARALGYFEKALPLSRDFTERKNAEMRIKQCRGLLGK